MADEATRRTPLAMAMSTAPDVCKTPSGPTLVPVPYPIVGVFNLASATKPKVLFTNQEAFTTGSKITKVTGDEAGVGGGVKSGVNISTCEFITYSSTVLAQGENIVRHNDTMWMNNKNTTGKVNYPIGLAANVSPSGGIPDDADPETTAETPAEEIAKQEKKGFWGSAWEGAKENLGGKWQGIKDAASDPGKAIGDFAGGVKEAVLNPVETAKKVGGAIKDTAEEAYDAYQTGDMDKLGKMAGSGLVEVGIGAVGTKGLDKLGKLSKIGGITKKLPDGKKPDVDVPKTTNPDIDAPPKKQPDSGNGRSGSSGSDGGTVTRKVSAREKYMGRTPSKKSKTGRDVIDRMKKEGTVREGPDGSLEFKSAKDGNWYPLKDADMAHKNDAVTWWNETGRHHGPKSPEVRQWMKNPDNYYLEHFSHNRSAGARLGQTYIPP